MANHEVRQLLHSLTPENLQRLFQLLINNPKSAQQEFRVETSWVVNPESPNRLVQVYHEGSPAPDPVEYLLHALAGCVSESVILQAAAQRVELTSVHVDATATHDVRGMLGMSNKIRNGLANVRLAVSLAGDASKAKLRELLLLAQYRSPILDTLTSGVPVSLSEENAAPRILFRAS